MSGVVSNVFKSICDDILQPAGVKVGGYPDEIFANLSVENRDSCECMICYLTAKEAQRCVNGHAFCAACIYAWALTSEDNVDRCPVCRVHGPYRGNTSADAALAKEDVSCTVAGCGWRGKLATLREHEHGFELLGKDARQAGLPAIRNSSGETIFPDFGDAAIGGGATIEMERVRRRQRLARMHGHILDGQARLAFLMSLFEEDLERRRNNLAAIASMQRRFHGQHFDQVMRLEQELGEITANLLRLIDNASGEARRFTGDLHRQSGGETTVLTALPLTSSRPASTILNVMVNGASRLPIYSEPDQQAPSNAAGRLLRREALTNGMQHTEVEETDGGHSAPLTDLNQRTSILRTATTELPSDTPRLQPISGYRDSIAIESNRAGANYTTSSSFDSARQRSVATESAAGRAVPMQHQRSSQLGDGVLRREAVHLGLPAASPPFRQHTPIAPPVPSIGANAPGYNPHVISYPPRSSAVVSSPSASFTLRESGLPPSWRQSAAHEPSSSSLRPRPVADNSPQPPPSVDRNGRTASPIRRTVQPNSIFRRQHH